MVGGTYIDVLSHDEIQIPNGQAVKVIDDICRKTCLREDDGSEYYGDKGFFLTLEILGGPCDGDRFQIHDIGEHLDCEDDDSFV